MFSLATKAQKFFKETFPIPGSQKEPTAGKNSYPETVYTKPQGNTLSLKKGLEGEPTIFTLTGREKFKKDTKAYFLRLKQDWEESVVRHLHKPSKSKTTPNENKNKVRFEEPKKHTLKTDLSSEEPDTLIESEVSFSQSSERKRSPSVKSEQNSISHRLKKKFSKSPKTQLNLDTLALKLDPIREFPQPVFNKNQEEKAVSFQEEESYSFSLLEVDSKGLLTQKELEAGLEDLRQALAEIDKSEEN